jgi:hypothetical protein
VQKGHVFIRVRNFEEYQHYKNRAPRWVKLYASILHKKWFQALKDAHKLHIIALLLLASQNDNALEWDTDWLSKEISSTEPLNLQVLLETRFFERIPYREIRKKSASKSLAGCYQVASNPLALKEKIREEKTGLASEPYKTDPAEVIQTWNKTPGVRPTRKLGNRRKSHLRARLREADWPWREALAKFPLSCFRDGKWIPTFDWFIRSETADKILEGIYDFEIKDDRARGASRLATDEDKRNYTPHG